jgi:arginyl-tRNA synthetase
MLRFASGKMSSRKGNVITGESLISQVEDIVKEKVKDRNYSEIEKKDIVEKVAIGAIKYSILHQAIGGDIIFDFDKSISFEGDSGPYLQYSYVRAQSILAKAGKIELRSMNYACPVAKNSDFSATGELRMKEKTGKETEKLEKMLYRFPEVVERAGRESAPHYIATYLTELAGAFNGFYANEKIVDEKDPNSPYKISLTEAVSIVLKNGLNLLGIGVPEKM